jgi:predicted ferric reductase
MTIPPVRTESRAAQPFPQPRVLPDLALRHRNRMWRVDGLQIASWISVAIVIALFLADDARAGFSSVGESVTSLGILTGLVGTDLLLIMLLLAARLPLVDKAFGHDRAIVFHRQLGKPVLYLLLAHTVLLIFGYGINEGISAVAETVSLWATVPDMPLAFIGLGLLIAVVVSSVVSVQRKYPYEVWFAIHLLAYAAVLASLPHQFSTGAIFAAGTWQRYYWLGLYLLAAGSIAIFRIIIPLVRTNRHGLRVSEVIPAGEDAVTIRMTGAHLEMLGVQAGQFFLWRFLARGLWWHAHPFSLSAAPTASGLEITVRGRGAGTRRLLAVHPGTRVAIEGPYGIFSQAARTSERLVMVGAGIGTAPIRSLLEEADFEPGNAVVILRAGSEAELFLAREMYQLCERRGAYLYLETGPRPRDRQHWLPEASAGRGFALTDYAPAVAGADVFVCGPQQWSELVIAEAKAAGVPSEAIHYERFNW